ncbi:DNA polymerase III subunit delta' [Candidatus Tisiphia endosymbiont of Nemotelus uliginosus]|uniref:DNA polymerase III subunit delta' n=1 Tax=Candidatus Tisiphia endosymbiont of Nemotelus uliginosus TaxID=3077926 RepID=UPI0035C8D4E4
MIQEHLKFRLKQGRFYNSWLIDTPDIAATLEDLHIFIVSELFLNNMQLNNHPDYRLIAREEGSNAASISIEQIRDLHKFFYRTPSISKYRVAIIYQADLMTLNAANSCLKLLEDTPKNSIIFLITSRTAAIISTLRSRCFKFNVKLPNYFDDNNTYIKVITSLADYPSTSIRLALVEEVTSKNKELWGDFAYSILYLVNKITKKSLNYNIILNHLENKIFTKMAFNSSYCLIKKFTNLKTIINNTVDYDLNLKASTINLIEELFCLSN